MNRTVYIINWIIILSIAGLQACQAQNGILRLFDDSAPEAAVFLDIVNDNDTLIFYGVTGDSLNRPGIGFYKIDTLGNVLQKRLMVDTARLFSSSSWGAKRIIKTADDHYAMFGTTNAEIGSSVGAPYFVKLDKHLNIVHRVIYTSQRFTRNRDFMEDDNGFLIACSIEQEDYPWATNMLLIKTDIEGKELWRREYGSATFSEGPTEIRRVGDNELVIYGFMTDITQPGDQSWPQSTWATGYIWTVDNDGNLLSEWQGDTSAMEGAIGRIQSLEDGGIVGFSVTWELWQGGPWNHEYRGRPTLFRLDADGNVVWEQVFGRLGSFSHGFYDINRTHDGHFLVSGIFDHPDPDDQSSTHYGVHYKFDINGDSIWMRQDSVYSQGKMYVISSEILSSGNILSIGYDRRGPYGQTGFIMKMTKDGCIDSLNCFPFSSTGEVMLDGDALHLYPNPALEQITIDVPAAMRQDALMLIRDLHGRVIHEGRLVGAEQYNLDLAGWSAGHYFVEMASGREKVFGRFVKVE